MVVPGRTLPRYKAWLEPLQSDLPPEVRSDLASALKTEAGLLAVPLTLDAPLLVYRADLWQVARLPVPTSTAALREALLFLRAHGKGGSTPLVSTVPEGVLLRSLSASAEGEVQESLHRFSSVHTLEFMREFRLTARSQDEVAQAFSMGQCAAAFLMASDVARIHSSDSLKVLPLPSRLTPIAIYDGWCAVGVPGKRWGASNPLELLSPQLQAALASGGQLPVLPAAEKKHGEVEEAMATTRLVLASGDSSAEAALEGAFLDVFGGGVEPEEALRRAEARRNRNGVAP